MASEVGRESNRSKPLKVLNKELGDFVLLDRIGEGGMGTVFRATQKSLNRLVAVKILSPRIAKNAEFIVRFKREAKAAAALSHPNIVRAIAVGEDQGFHFFVMELLEGETVRQRFKREGPLPLRDVLEIGRQTALALSHAHRKGILHRDIKPENLMLMQSSAGPSVKVMDLGLARLVTEDSAATQSGVAIGTPFYSAPEQSRGMQNLTPACDLYSLGATLFHIATGKPVFEGASAVETMTKHVTERPPDPKKLKPSLPDKFCALLLRLLAKKPEDRCESAAALAGELQALMDAESSPAAGERGADDDGTGADRLGGARGKAAARRRAAGRHGQVVALNPLYLVGAGVALLVLAIPILSRPSSSPESTRRAPEPVSPKTATKPSNAPADPERERLDAMLSAALALERNQPDDLEAQRRAWTELKRAGTGRRQGSQAEVKLAQLDAKFAGSRGREPDLQTAPAGDVLAQARDQAAKGDFNAALALLDSLAQRNQPGPGKEQVDAAITELQNQAKTAGEALLKQAADLEAAGDRQGAFAAYTVASRFKYEPVSSKAAQKVEALKGTDTAKEPVAQPAVPKVAAQPLVALIKRLRQAAGPTQFDTARDELGKALNDPVYAPNVQALKVLDAGSRSVPELYPLIEKRLAQSGKQGLVIPGSPAVYLKLDNGLLYYKPRPAFPGNTNRPVESVKAAELVALSGIGEAENLSTIPAPKLGAFGTLLLLIGQNKAAQRLFERGIAQGQAALAEWHDILAVLDAEETESLAAKAWTDAEALFARKQYEAAHLAYLAFKADYKGSKALTDKNAALAERLAEIEALVKPRTETDPAPKAQPKDTAPPVPDEPSTPAPPPKTPPPAAAASWANAVNLVPLANPARDAIAGIWRLQAGKLLSNNHRSARLEFPYQPPEEYDARLTLSRFGGEDEVALILSKAGHSFAYVMGGRTGKLFGVESVGDQPYDKNPTTKTRLAWIKPGDKHTCTVQVRNDSLRVLLDDEEVLDYKTDFRNVRLARASPWRLSHADTLGIGSKESPTNFHSLEVLEITGKGNLIR